MGFLSETGTYGLDLSLTTGVMHSKPVPGPSAPHYLHSFLGHLCTLTVPSSVLTRLLKALFLLRGQLFLASDSQGSSSQLDIRPQPLGLARGFLCKVTRMVSLLHVYVLDFSFYILFPLSAILS